MPEAYLARRASRYAAYGPRISLWLIRIAGVHQRIERRLVPRDAFDQHLDISMVAADDHLVGTLLADVLLVPTVIPRAPTRQQPPKQR